MARRKGGGGGGGNQQESPLVVEIGDLKHGAGGWHLDVTVRYKGKLDMDPTDTGTIYFLTEGSADKVKNDKAAESIVIDKGTKSAKTTLVFEKGGQKKLYAVLEGHETSQPVTVSLPKTDEAKAAKILPREFVLGTRCTVNIQVLSKGDTPVKGVEVQVADAALGLKATTPKKTNAKGFCTYEFDFDPATERKRKLLLQVPGTDVELPCTIYF